MEYNEEMKDIDKNILGLMDKKSMSTSDALIYANNVIKKISDAIRTGVRDRATLYSLYKKAERTYLLAAKRVPKDEHDIVADQAEYWRACAEQSRISIKI